MNQQFEISYDELEVPAENSDERARIIPWSINKEQKNVLLRDKGKLKDKDCMIFGIETVPFNNNIEIESIEVNKDMMLSFQPERSKCKKGLLTIKEDYWKLNVPKRIAKPKLYSWMSSTKMSSKKMLEILLSRNQINLKI